MDYYTLILLFIGLLFPCTAISSNSNEKTDHLPQSIVELKTFYEVVEVLGKRGVLTEDQVKKEKQIYIE